MRRNRFIATIAAGLGIIALVPVATALGDDPGEPAGRTVEAATALGTAFTYQGRLTDAGSPANGTYDLRFILWDAEPGGAQVGTTQSKDDVVVANGLFTVDLDFGVAAWNGDARWVEIAVRAGASSGTYTVLSPRQPISPTPYALFAKAAAGFVLPFVASGSSASSGTSGLVTVTQTGTGIAISGTRSSTDASEFPGVLGVNAGGGAGVQGESTFSSGVGVQGFAIGASGTGGHFSGPTALELDGPIKVSGPNPTAFIQTVATGNKCATDTATIIDNPLTNGDPDAILIVTINATSSGAFGLIEGGVGVTYDPGGGSCNDGADKWVIFTTGPATSAPPAAPVSLVNGQQFNVLVIKQ